MRGSEAAERRAAESGYRYVGGRELREREWSDLRGDLDEIAPSPAAFEALCALLKAGDRSIIDNPRALKKAIQTAAPRSRPFRRLSIEEHRARERERVARYRQGRRALLAAKERSRRANRREEINSRRRDRWHAKPKEERSMRDRNQRLKYAASIRARRAKYRAEKRELLRSKDRAYYASNREAVRARQNARRAQRKGSVALAA